MSGYLIFTQEFRPEDDDIHTIILNSFTGEFADQCLELLHASNDPVLNSTKHLEVSIYQEFSPSQINSYEVVDGKNNAAYAWLFVIPLVAAIAGFIYFRSHRRRVTSDKDVSILRITSI